MNKSHRWDFVCNVGAEKRPSGQVKGATWLGQATADTGPLMLTFHIDPNARGSVDSKWMKPHKHGHRSWTETCDVLASACSSVFVGLPSSSLGSAEQAIRSAWKQDFEALGRDFAVAVKEAHGRRSKAAE